MSRPGQQHCTFCDLIAGAGEVSVCYEDAEAVAFMDIQPVNTGHVLVVPRQHMESLFEVPRELGGHLFDVTMRVANAVRGVTGCEDMNIVVNSGVEAGQDEMHYHVHIIPRREGDGFDIPLPFDGSEMPDRTRLAATAALIVAALRDPMRTAHGAREQGAAGGRGEAREREQRGPGAQEGGQAARGGAGGGAGAGRETVQGVVAARAGEPARPANGAEDDLVRREAVVDAHEGPHGELVRVATTE